MISSLFQTVLLVNMKMTLPILFALLLAHILKRHIKSQFIYRMEKYVIIGIWLSMALACFCPVVQITMPATDFPYHFVQEAFSPNIILPQQDFISKSDSNITFFNPQLDIIWAGMTCLFLLLFVYQNARLFLRLRHNRIAASSHIMNISTNLCEKIQIGTPPKIFISNDIISPQTVGLICPVIVLPSCDFPEESEKQRLLLLHELYHYKDKDNCWKFFVFLIVAISWFNPLIWVLRNSFSTVCELACDEKVLERASSEERHLYAEMLIFFSDSGRTAELSVSVQSKLRSSFRATKLRVEQASFTGLQHMNGRFIHIFIMILLLPGLFNIQLHQDMFFNISLVPNYAIRNLYINESNFDGYTTELLPLISKTEKTFQLPFTDATVYNMKNIDEDGHIYHNVLYVLASKNKEVVTTGCEGIVVAIQEKDINDLDGEEVRLSPFGKYVIVDYGNGLTIRYTFLSSVTVQVGQTVSPGDILGVAGHTGLSYGDIDQCGIYVMQEGTMVDPLLFFDVDVPVQIIS